MCVFLNGYFVIKTMGSCLPLGNPLIKHHKKILMSPALLLKILSEKAEKSCVTDGPLYAAYMPDTSFHLIFMANL